MKELNLDIRYQDFVPSKELSYLVEQSIEKPDKEELKLLDGLEKMQLYVDTEERSIESIITDQVEGAFRSVGETSYTNKKPIKITKDNRLTNEFYLNLKERLEIQKNSDLISNKFYSELRAFASTLRERKWGYITSKDSDIIIYFKEGAEEVFKVVDLKNVE